MPQPDVMLTLGLDLPGLTKDAKKGGDILAEHLGMANKPGQTPGQQNPAQSFVAEMEKLLALSTDVAKSYESMTRAIREQIALREKELMLQRVGSIAAQPSGITPGTSGGGSGGFFGGAGAIVGLPHSRLANGQGKALDLAGRLGDAGRTAGQLTQSWLSTSQGGWQGGDVARSAANTIDSIPVLGRIMGGYSSALNAIGDAGDTQAQWRTARYQAFQAGGEGARANFTNLWDYGDGRERMVRAGIDRDMSLQMERDAQRAYGADVGNQYDVQGRFGLGQEQTQLMGALRRGGNAITDSGDQAFAETIGVAFATSLERGRWGEAFTALTRAAQGVLYGNVDLQRLVAQQTFVGQLGRQYQGDTPQAQKMTEMMNRWGGGQANSFVNTMALQEAMGATGGDYWAAKAMVEGGLGSDRGMSHDMLMNMIRRMQPTRAYLSGQMSKKHAAGVLAQITGEPINRLMDLLDGLKSEAGTRKGPDNAAILQDLRGGQMPSVDMMPTRGSIGRQHAYNKGFDQQGVVKTLEDGAAHPQGVPNMTNVDPSQWAHVGTDIQQGMSSRQSGVSARDYAAFRQSPEARDPFVSDMAEAEMQFARNRGHGMGQVRDHDARGTKLPVGKHLVHGARDIYMPAGSPVHTPVGGVWKKNGSLRKQGATYGFYGELTGDDGLLYRFLHLEDRPTLSVGVQYPSGTLIGYTVRTKIGKSQSHLHLEAWEGGYKTGRRVDPFGRLGAEGVNRLYTGHGSRADYDSAQAGPATTPGGSGAPPASSAAEPSSAASGASAQRLRVDLHVHDARVTVTQRAGQARNTGAAGQNYSTKVP